MVSVDAGGKEECTYICTNDTASDDFEDSDIALRIEGSIIQGNPNIDSTYSSMTNPERSRGQGFGHVKLVQLDARREFELCAGYNGEPQPPCVIRELQWIEIQGVQRHGVRDHSQPAKCQRCSMPAIRGQLDTGLRSGL
jgi:hypothetical protein